MSVLDSVLHQGQTIVAEEHHAVNEDRWRSKATTLD
jgi:hypothetical protein